MNTMNTMNPGFYNDVVKGLQHYMLDEDNIRGSIIHLVNDVKKEYKNVPKYTKTTENKLFQPREKDTLFWCLYVMKHGDTSYELLKNRNYITEKKLKIDYVEQIRKDKQLIKAHKFATLIHLENNLANEDRIDVRTFLSLCVLENLNVVYINKKTYFELLMNDDKTIHVIHCLDNCKFGHEIKTTKEEVTANLYQLDNIEKPIKSISSYKIQELIDICNKLSIDTTNYKNKKDLYEMLVMYF